MNESLWFDQYKKSITYLKQQSDQDRPIWVDIHEEIVDRITEDQEIDPTTNMRIKLYIFDITTCVCDHVEENNNKLLGRIKDSPGYQIATNSWEISDETTISFINEVRAK